MDLFIKYGVLAQSSEIEPQWTKVTNMNVLPGNDGWTPLINTGLEVVSNGILTVTTNDTGLVYNIETDNVDASKIKRLETRVKVNSSYGDTERPSHFLLIADGVRRFFLFIESDKISLGDSSTTPTTIYTGDMTVFNVVRLEYNNVFGLKLYVNGNLEHTESYANLIASTTNFIRFGDSSGTTSDFDAILEYDYVNYQLDLANNPDQ